MLAQGLKDIYFLVNQFAVLPNTWCTRLRFRNKKGLILHLGSGDDYRRGMINIDGNFRRKKDLWLDLRNGLPFATGSVRLIYCCHMLEHVLPEDAITLLKEMHRIIASDGVIRLAVPSFERCLEIAAGRDESHWPRDFQNSMAQAINYLFCDGQHKYAYCFENLRVFAETAGFEHVYNYSAEYGVTPHEYGQITLGNEPPGSLVVELRSSDTESQTS